MIICRQSCREVAGSGLSAGLPVLKLDKFGVHRLRFILTTNNFVLHSKKYKEMPFPALCLP